MSNNIQNLNKNRSLIVNNNILIVTKNDKECKLNLLELPYLFTGELLQEVFSDCGILTYEDKMSSNIVNCILCLSDIKQGDEIIISDCCYDSMVHLDCQLNFGYSQNTCIHCIKTFEFKEISELNDDNENKECYICYMEKSESDDKYLILNSCCDKWSHYECFKQIKKPNTCSCCKSIIEIKNRPKKLLIKDLMLKHLAENKKRDEMVYKLLNKEPITVLYDEDYYEETDDETESEPEPEESFRDRLVSAYNEEDKELDEAYLEYLFETNEFKNELKNILRFDVDFEIKMLISLYNLYLKNIDNVYREAYLMKLNIFNLNNKCEISLGLKDPSLPFKIYSTLDEDMISFLKLHSTMTPEEIEEFNADEIHLGGTIFSLNYYNELPYKSDAVEILIELIKATKENDIENIEKLTHKLKYEHNHVVTLKFD